MSTKGVDHLGIPTEDEFWKASCTPSRDRLLEKPVAIVECFQEIPCNVCEKACPFDAIKVGHTITRIPILFGDKCVGCGSCIPACPGLAIFTIDLTHSDKYATISFPYEFLPVPKLEEEVDAVDRTGRFVCKAKVVKVVCSEEFDKTYVVTIRIPKEHAMKVRFIRLLEK